MGLLLALQALVIILLGAQIQAFCRWTPDVNGHVDLAAHLVDPSEIPDYSFDKCLSLKSVSIPDTVTSIGYAVFRLAEALEELVMPSSVLSIGNNLCYGCSNLKKIVFSPHLTDIGEGCLRETRVSEVKLPTGLTSIPAEAFYRCLELKQVVIPSGVTYLGSSSFDNSAIKSIHIPKKVTNIFYAAFYRCISLMDVTFEQDSELVSIANEGFYKCSSLRSIALPPSLETIGTNAFAYSRSLTTLGLSSSHFLTTIPEGLCLACINLGQVTIPISVTEIRSAAFKGAHTLREVTISYADSQLVQISDSAFEDCVELTTLALNSRLVTIGNNAFYNVQKLTSLIIPPNVNEVGNMAFLANRALTSLVVMPTSVEVGLLAFPSTGSIKEVTFHYNATSITGSTSALPRVWCNGTACACMSGNGGTVSSSSGEMVTCTACEPGHFSPSPRSGKCSACALGKYATGTGSTVCSDCGSGKTTPTMGSSRFEHCQPCGAGTYNPLEGSVCYPCQRGRYVQEIGQTSCINCTKGSFNVVTGASSASICELCGKGKYSSKPGAVSESTCVYCPPGLTPNAEEGSSECLFSPTGQPTSRPTGQPTRVPTGQPTTAPTIQEGTVVSYSHETRISQADLSSGLGLFYRGEHTFRNLGLYNARYYLSLFVYDTGFGPVKEGEYVSFVVNGEALLAPDKSQTTKLLCAPAVYTRHGNANTSMTKCQHRFHPCAFNIDITDKIRTANGGSVNVGVVSHGVLTSACPYINPSDYTESIVYAKYVVSSYPQDTPSPTFAPTPGPTEGSVNVYNGLQFNINKLDAWVLLQVSLGIGLVMGICGAFLTNIRKKAEGSIYQHPIAYATVFMGLLASEITSMIFMLMTFAAYGFSVNAIVLGVYRLLQCLAGGGIIACIFGPPSVRERVDLMPLIDEPHLVAESKVYILVSVFSFIDVGFVVFLPWRDSTFATLSKGYPNLWVWRLSNTVSVTSVLVALGCEISFLRSSNQPFDSDRDLLVVFNIILLAIKSFFILVEGYYKAGALSDPSCTTADKEDPNGKGKEEEGSGVEEGLQMTDNPMHKGNATIAVIRAPNDGELESASLLILMRDKLEMQTERVDRLEREMSLLRDKEMPEQESSEINVQV